MAAAAMVYITIDQLLSVCWRMKPNTTGATKPAKLPSMFMVEETVAVYSLPISTQVFQEIGMVRSDEKLATAIRAIAAGTLGTPGMMKIRTAVVKKPPTATHLRGMESGRKPETMEPKPPAASGQVA